MVLLRLSVTALTILCCLLEPTLARAVPSRLVDKLRGLSSGARDLLKRSTPAAPRFVVYDDAQLYSFPSVEDLKGYNVYALSFWLTSGPRDMALAWQGLTDSQRTSYLNEYNAAGISIVVSAFGSTEQPTTANADPITVADNLASWVLQYGLQGVDIDYEDSTAFYNSERTTAEQWLISFTRELRTKLPQGDYILSHAPLAPWFSPDIWSGGGYLYIDQTVGNMIDWYNIQFYNQGATEYTSCPGLLHQSSSRWPETAVFQIAAQGVDQDKLVIGKYATPQDGISGYMSPEDLRCCVQEAQAAGWNAGVMVWQYSNATSAWINTVRGDTS